MFYVKSKKKKYNDDKLLLLLYSCFLRNNVKENKTIFFLCISFTGKKLKSDQFIREERNCLFIKTV